MTTDPVHDAAVYEKSLLDYTKRWYSTFDSLKERALEEAKAGHTGKLVEAIEANPTLIAGLLADTPFADVLAALWAKDNVERYL